MKSYSEREVFTARHLELLRQATSIVDALPDLPDERLRCHEVARIVGRILGLSVLDGYAGIAEHSWLRVVPGPEGKVGVWLDVYTVGRLPMVQLVWPSRFHGNELREESDFWDRCPARPPDEALIDELVQAHKLAQP